MNKLAVNEDYDKGHRSHDARPLRWPGKSDALEQLGETPLVAQTPESLLNDDTTPTALMFIRNNGLIPERPRDPDTWTFTIDGEVDTPLKLTLKDLKARYPHVTRRLVVECGGNGRSFLSPPVKGNRWTHGGVGCPEWTGVRLADVLKDMKPKPTAVFSGHYGADPSITEPGAPALSRGVPIKKLLDGNNLLAWAINGEPLPQEHGFPLRLIIPGWPGACSAKWLTRIWIRDRHHDGPGMTGISYKVPIRPMPPPVPGQEYDRANLRDLESMPVRSIITSPADGTRLRAGTKVALRGAAWAGDFKVKQVEISTDRGRTWQPTTLAAPNNPYDWQRWTAEIAAPSSGSLEIWARATDENGATQPLEPDNWNPHGVGVNPVHRINVAVG